MYQYKDLSGITRIATITLWIYMLLQLLFGIFDYLQNVALVPSLNNTDFGATEFAGLFSFLSLIVTVIIVGRWTYRASVNAHAIAQDLKITPGWAVGWYFIPIANLLKPFQAMKETWLASHHGIYWESHTAPGRLRAWWTLWIITNIIGNIAFRTTNSAPAASAICSLIQGIIEIPLSLILIGIMRAISRAQNATINHDVFA